MLSAFDVANVEFIGFPAVNDSRFILRRMVEACGELLTSDFHNFVQLTRRLQVFHGKCCGKMFPPYVLASEHSREMLDSQERNRRAGLHRG